ncbi:unnamed protein product [Lasius platythorax]|uniref:Uncharacterized protein n=1 Tax=Lasius platythorax TaxID=488582 RepID=A0AAV2P2B9_9HYME
MVYTYVIRRENLRSSTTHHSLTHTFSFALSSLSPSFSPFLSFSLSLTHTLCSFTHAFVSRVLIQLTYSSLAIAPHVCTLRLLSLLHSFQGISIPFLYSQQS